MQKTITTLLMSLALAGLPAFSQDEPNKSASDKPSHVTVVGTVTNFDVGKSIEVDAKGGPRKYDLNSSDTVYTISPEIANGMTVKITETMDSSGHKTVVIEPSAKTKKPTE